MRHLRKWSLHRRSSISRIGNLTVSFPLSSFHCLSITHRARPSGYALACIHGRILPIAFLVGIPPRTPSFIRSLFYHAFYLVRIYLTDMPARNVLELLYDPRTCHLQHKERSGNIMPRLRYNTIKINPEVSQLMEYVSIFYESVV